MSSECIIEFCVHLYLENWKNNFLETLEICKIAIRNITDISIWNFMGKKKFNPKDMLYSFIISK